MPRSTSKLPAALMRRLELAAEKRAAGMSWAVVAAAVGRTLAVVQRWPSRYPEIWPRLLQAAREQQTQEAGNEALSTLRSHLRGKDAKLSQDAAKKLLDHCPPPKPSAHAEDLDAYYGSLDENGKKELDAALNAADEQP